MQPDAPEAKEFTKNIPQSEDCLFLSVYTPSQKLKNDSKLLPVVIWVHGGGFKWGCGMFPIYGPERFMLVINILLLSIINKIIATSLIFNSTCGLSIIL